MRKRRYLAMTVFMALMLAIGAAGCAPQGPEAPPPAESPSGQNPGPSQAGTTHGAASGKHGAANADPARGRDIYSARCAACHGVNGEGGIGPAFVAKGRNPAVTERLSEAEHYRIVADGRNAMPPFRGQLTDQEIRDVVAFERSLR